MYNFYDLNQEKLRNWNKCKFVFNGQCENCKKANQLFFSRCRSKKCIKCLENKLFKNIKKTKILTSSLYVKARSEAKRKKEKTFKCNAPCNTCGERGKRFYTSQNVNRCVKCTTKTQYQRVKSSQTKKIASIARSRVSTMVKKLTGSSKNYKIGTFENIFGCTEPCLLKWLESKFTHKMTWENYGSYWHVDHIIPISSFDLTDSKQCKQANHWTNLQPLEASANLAKSNTMTKPQMSLMLNL